MTNFAQCLRAPALQQEQPATFAVLFYVITHGAKNDKTMPGYMLENGVELADWLTITADGQRLYLAIDDYLGMIRGQRTDCRAYDPRPLGLDGWQRCGTARGCGPSGQGGRPLRGYLRHPRGGGKV